MKITGFLILDHEGSESQADAFGDSIAFTCSDCGHPVLATSLQDQRGSDEDHPSECPGCGTRYFLDLRPTAEKLYIQKLDDKDEEKQAEA